MQRFSMKKLSMCKDENITGFYANREWKLHGTPAQDVKTVCSGAKDRLPPCKRRSLTRQKTIFEDDINGLLHMNRPSFTVKNSILRHKRACLSCTLQTLPA